MWPRISPDRIAKNPHYAMVTGVADLRRGGLGQLGQSVIYVAEFSTGKLAAYALPWTTGRENVLSAFQGSFVLLNIIKFRSVEIRK